MFMLEMWKMKEIIAKGANCVNGTGAEGKRNIEIAMGRVEEGAYE